MRCSRGCWRGLVSFFFPEPPLHGSFRGDDLLRVPTQKDHPDSARTPGGVQVLQPHRGPVLRGGAALVLDATVGVIRPQARLPSLLVAVPDQFDGGIGNT